jgi:hypothetical protein
MNGEEKCFFFVKTNHNYLTGMAENKEIGYSNNLMTFLKMNKKMDIITSAMRNCVEEIFCHSFKQELF